MGSKSLKMKSLSDVTVILYSLSCNLIIYANTRLIKEGTSYLIVTASVVSSSKLHPSYNHGRDMILVVEGKERRD